MILSSLSSACEPKFEMQSAILIQNKKPNLYVTVDWSTLNA